MNFDDLQKRAVDISAKYDQLNKQSGGQTWQPSNYMAGLVGDIGDLSKLLMAKDKLRVIDDVDAKLAHELSDCLWSVLVLADKLKLNLANEFMKTMDELDKRLDPQLTE